MRIRTRGHHKEATRRSAGSYTPSGSVAPIPGGTPTGTFVNNSQAQFPLPDLMNQNLGGGGDWGRRVASNRLSRSSDAEHIW